MALDGTYAGLQASVADFLPRPDLTAQIPDFIRMFEYQFDRAVRVADQIVSTTLTINAASTALPADFNGVVSLELPAGSGGPLTNKQPLEIRALKQSAFSAPGTPFAFAIVGTNVETAPAPSGAFACPFLYYARLPALTASNTTNWLLTKHADIYLYGTLLQTAMYLKDDGRIQGWGGLLQQFMNDLVASDGRTAFGHNLIPPYRSAAAPIGNAAVGGPAPAGA